MPMPIPASFAVLVAGLLALAGCSPLGAFNTVAGGPAGSRAVASDIAYGPEPRQALDIYSPSDPVSGAPVVLFFYGGSWNSGSRGDYAFVGRALAAEGFVTIVADYRLVPQVRFPAFVEDGAAALRWVVDNIARHGGDSRRIALVGHSAGAYNAVMLALDPRFLRQAGVDPAVIRGVVGLAGPYNFYPYSGVTAAAFGNVMDPDVTQPVNKARAGVAPMFLAHGADDGTVNPRSTRTLAARLRAKGSSAEDKIYPGQNHIDPLLAIPTLTRSSRQPLYDDMIRFLKARLGTSRGA